MLASGGTALVLMVLFRIERGRAQRFFESLRRAFDAVCVLVASFFSTRIPEINSIFFQELIHYVTHVLLSKALGFLRSLESLTLTVVRFNRTQAMRLRTRVKTAATETSESAPLVAVQPSTSSEHLQAIAEHKKAVELTDRQKIKRKNDALEG